MQRSEQTRRQSSCLDWTMRRRRRRTLTPQLWRCGRDFKKVVWLLWCQYEEAECHRTKNTHLRHLSPHLVILQLKQRFPVKVFQNKVICRLLCRAVYQTCIIVSPARCSEKYHSTFQFKRNLLSFNQWNLYSSVQLLVLYFFHQYHIRLLSV